MIISTAPARIGLFGGGTDLPEYANEYGGLVINFAINLRQHIKLGTPAFKIQQGDEVFYRTILDHFKSGQKLNASFDGVIEAGLGSSAAAAVALIGAISRDHNLNLNPHQIAEKAWLLEFNDLKLYGGKQDQFASAYGGVNFIEFDRKGVRVNPLARGFVEPLIPSMLLFYTGSNRKSSIIQEGFKKIGKAQSEVMHKIKELAVEAVNPIGEGEVDKVGYLLDVSWDFKKASNLGVTNPKIDKLYAKAKRLGAYGGKICGAGGGGYMLFIINPNKKAEFIERFEEPNVSWVDFSVDWNGVETRII